MEAQITRLIVKYYMNFRKISKTNNRNEEFLKKKKTQLQKNIRFTWFQQQPMLTNSNE